MLLASGQDIAGAGMIRGIMILLGIGVAGISGLVWLIAASDLRAPAIPWSTLWRNRAKIALTAIMAGGLLTALVFLRNSAPQFYDLSVGHRYEGDITAVIIRIGDEERRFERVKSNSYRNTWELSAAPESLDISWTDPEGISRQATKTLGGEIPQRYDNGELRIIILPTQEILTSYRFLRYPEF